MSLKRAEIIRLLGEVDDVIVAYIAASGARPDELAEAQAWVSNDEPLLNSGKRLPVGRIGQLVEILTFLKEEDTEPELV